MPNEDQNVLDSAAEPYYGMEFPNNFYERPMHAFQNLVMRGDVDAATRSIFQPDTLSPTEMKSLTSRLLGRNPNPLAKTVVDVATNPLVVIGLIGGYLLYPAMGGANLGKIFSGLKASVPKTGLIGEFVGGSYTRLRHLVTKNGDSMLNAIQDLNKGMLDFANKHHDLRVEAHGHLGTKIGRDAVEGHMMAASLLGWNKKLDRGLMRMYGQVLDDAGNVIGKEWGLKNAPMAPGLQAHVAKVDGLQSATDKTRSWFKGVWGEMQVGRDKISKVAKEQGTKLGEEIEDYFPKRGQENAFRRSINKNSVSYKEGYHDFKTPLSNSLKPQPGVNHPDLGQLRKLEAKGVITPGWADEIERVVDYDIKDFTNRLKAELNANGMTRTGIEKSVRNVSKNMDMDSQYVKHAINDIHSAANGVNGKTVEDSVNWAGEMLRRPGTYKLDLDDQLTRYVADMSKTHSYLVAPSDKAGRALGEKVDDLIDHFSNTIGTDGQPMLDKGGQHYVKNQLMPMNLGQKTSRAVARESKWATFRHQKADWLEKSTLANKMIPKDQRAWMINGLRDLSAVDYETMGHGINEYLYLSTMGGNLGPPSKNVLQNVLTFNNLPGMGGAMLEGAKEVMDRSMGYIGSVLSKKMTPEKAFSHHFKEFVESQGPRSGILEKIFGGTVAVGRPVAGKKKAIETFKDVMMAPFQISELWVNRLPAFYGARARGMAWNVGEDVVKAKGLTGSAAKDAMSAAATRMAGNIVDVSHFTGGPMGMPSGVMDWWAPARQFMQFPMRTMDFMMTSTRMGADPSKLNFSTIAKMLAASAGTYEVGKNALGLDLSAGLLGGALPLPSYEGSPFYPFPFVPPLAQMAGNVVKGVATGDMKPIQDIGPLLVPGGLAASRLKKTLGRKKADYKNRLEDGRVPVYNDRGGLIGAYTPLQLSLRSIGLMPKDVAAERGASKWLVTQRDQIRGYRQQWLEAQTANDPIKADRIQRDFKKQYPELGEMKFKKSDIHSIEQRRSTARISRIMRGMPKAYKPLFQNIVQEAQLGAFTQGAPQPQLPTGLEALR